MKLALNNIAYTRKRKQNFLQLMCRDEHGDFKQLEAPFEPYCFVAKKDSHRIPKPLSMTRMEMNSFYSYLEKEPLIKIYFRTPFDVGSFRRRMEKRGIPTYEADILFTKRFMIDKEIKFGIEYDGETIKPLDEDIDSNIKILFFDIEVKAPVGVGIDTLTREAKHPIVVISYWDSKERKVKRLSAKNKPEREIILLFIEAIGSINPDLMVAYNGDGFDIPYLMKRCQHHKIPIGRFSPLGKTKYYERDDKWVIKGRTILDYARAYRDYVGRELKISWFKALDYLADKYLGIKKIKINDFEKTWNENPSLIERRCSLDVAILVKLEEELKLIPMFDSIRKTIGCLFEDVFYKSKMVDIAMLRYLNRTYILPNKSRRMSEDVGYTGAYIVEPPVGIFEGITVLDFSEFYPRLILLYNISPETIERGGEKTIGGKYRFSTSKTGLLPALIKKYIVLKSQIKRELNLAKQGKNKSKIKMINIRYEAIKRVINAFYGSMAYTSRLPSIETTEAISLAGRQELQSIMKKLEDINVLVLYADTDSLFLKAPKEHTPEEISDYVKKLLPSGLEMELKMTFERIIFLSKKRYIGKTLEGEIVRKGIQTIRSDIEDFLGKAQDTLLLKILNKESKKSILSFVRKANKQIRTQSVPYHELAKPIQLKKKLSDYNVQSYHVVGSKYSNKYLKEKFYAGSKPRILRIKKTPKGFPPTKWLAISPEMVLPKGFKIDYAHYLKRLKQILKDILPLVGLYWKNVEYKSLDSFLKTKDETYDSSNNSKTKDN